MGCDIHLYAEARMPAKKTLIERLMFWKKKPLRWTSIETSWCLNDHDNPYLDIHWKQEFYSGGRNYNLFSALAGVRSYEFTQTIYPVSQPKGIPDDCCDLIRNIIFQWRRDGHSHSYNTLAELKSYDWEQWGNTCDLFLKEVIPKMEAMKLPDDCVRIVYFFDN